MNILDKIIQDIRRFVAGLKEELAYLIPELKEDWAIYIAKLKETWVPRFYDAYSTGLVGPSLACIVLGSILFWIGLVKLRISNEELRKNSLKKKVPPLKKSVPLIRKRK